MRKSEDLLYIQTFAALTDTISDSFGIPQACGEIEYELMDAYGEVAPENLITLVYTAGDPTLSIEINAKEFDGEAPMTIPLYLEAKITNYYPLVAS